MSVDSPIKNHCAEQQLFLARTVAAALIMTAMLAILIARLGYLQIGQHDYYALRSNDNRTRVQVVPPVRGLIYDRNGVVLADNVPAYRLEIVPEQVDDLSAALDRLSRVVTIRAADRKRLRERLRTQPGFRGIPIRLNLSQAEVARFEVNRREFPGMEIRAGLTRHYPLGALTAHVVGYVGGISTAQMRTLDEKRYRGTNHIGKTGVEDSYESILHGEPGSRVVETNALGRTLRQLEFTPSRAGHGLYLTLDTHLQAVAYDALGNLAGAVVALDPHTGGVLAMVSKPSFNPDPFVDGISQKAYRALLRDPRRPLFDRALQGQYPPGSTIKPVMALAALENQTIDPKRKIWCPGYITLPGSHHRWHDWKRSGQGWTNLTRGIYRSSDVYFYKLGMNLGIDAMHHFGSLFGLGRRTGIDLPRESDGLMPSRAWKHAQFHQPWYPGETLNTVIGQGFTTATPLQLAQMTALIAARGHGHQPHVFMTSENPADGSLKSIQDKPLPPIKLSSSHYWDLVTNAMVQVVSNPRGTAHWHVGLHLPYRMAGKSGTAQVRDLIQGKAAPKHSAVARQLRDHALFVAFAPAGDPRIAVAVIAEHGGGGSSIAGPIARKVIDAYLQVDPVVAKDP